MKPDLQQSPKKTPIVYADDDQLSVKRLFQLRFPALLIGLVLGVGLLFLTSAFDKVMRQSVEVAFFIPFIVYMAAAVGNQTQTIFARDLRSRHASFRVYLAKEVLLGLVIGSLAALLAGGVALWFGTTRLAIAVTLSMFTAIAVSPLVALFVTEVLQLERRDPAVGAGPIATVIQDTMSVLIYGIIASAIVLAE